MAYQMADGFDTYGNSFAMVAGKPWDFVAGTCTVINTDTAFAPPAGIPQGVVAISPNSYIRKNMSGNITPVIVLFRIKFTAIPGSADNDFVTFWDGGLLKISLAVTSLGGFKLWRGNNGAVGSGGVWNSTLLGSSASGLVVANTWYGMAMMLTMHGSAGAFSLYLGGANTTPVLNLSGLNTQGTGNAYINQVSLGNIANSGFNICRYDECVIYDTTGTYLNAMPTYDVRLYTKLPNAAGFYTNWTPTGSANNWQNAATAPPNTTNYNSNNVAGTKDSYSCPAAGITTAPMLVMVRGSLMADDAASHNPQLMVRSGSSDGVGAALPTLGSNYTYYDTVFPTDPATGAAWTGSAADAAQIGVVEG